jgi:hypothetical protein
VIVTGTQQVSVQVGVPGEAVSLLYRKSKHDLSCVYLLKNNN